MNVECEVPVTGVGTGTIMLCDDEKGEESILSPFSNLQDVWEGRCDPLTDKNLECSISGVSVGCQLPVSVSFSPVSQDAPLVPSDPTSHHQGTGNISITDINTIQSIDSQVDRWGDSVMGGDKECVVLAGIPARKIKSRKRGKGNYLLEIPEEDSGSTSAIEDGVPKGKFWRGNAEVDSDVDINPPKQNPPADPSKKAKVSQLISATPVNEKEKVSVVEGVLECSKRVTLTMVPHVDAVTSSTREAAEAFRAMADKDPEGAGAIATAAAIVAPPATLKKSHLKMSHAQEKGLGQNKEKRGRMGMGMGMGMETHLLPDHRTSPVIDTNKVSEKVSRSKTKPTYLEGETSPDESESGFQTVRRGKKSKKAFHPSKQTQNPKSNQGEGWGEKGSKEFRNVFRTSRSTPRTAWLDRVSPPKADTQPKQHAKPAIIVDGFPIAWQPPAIMQAIREGMDRVEELTYLLCESVHRLPSGGLLMVYTSMEEVNTLLQHSHKIVIRTGEGDLKVDFHLPGAVSEKRREAQDVRGRQAFGTLPKLLADSLRAEGERVRKEIKEGGKGEGVNTLVRGAEAQLLKTWIGNENISVMLLGDTGVMLTFKTSAEAETAISGGLPLRALGVRMKCRTFLPREDATLQSCRRCCGFGHTDARCPRQPQCRTCGEKGHSEVWGKCPKQTMKTKSLTSTPPHMWCVSCGQEGHKHGALSCPEYQAAKRSLLPRPGQLIQDRVRELQQLPSPHSECSIPTPGMNQVARHSVAIPEGNQPNQKIRTPEQVSQEPSGPGILDPMITSDDQTITTSHKKTYSQVLGGDRVVDQHGPHNSQHSRNAMKIVQDLSLVIDRLDPGIVSDNCMSMTDTVALLRLAVLEIVKLLNVSVNTSPTQHISNHVTHVPGSSHQGL